MNVDVHIQSTDLKGALGTYIKRRLTSRSAGSQESLGASVSVSKTSQEPTTFRMRPAAFELNFFAPDERFDTRPFTGICTSRSTSRPNASAAHSRRELDRVRSVGAVRNSQAATRYSPKRRLK